MKSTLQVLTAICLAALCAGCMSMDYLESEEFDNTGRGLFIINQGNFQYGNSSLSYYSPSTGIVENEVFARANGQKLGDTAQSMTIKGDTGWVVVNNSHVIYAIDTNSFKITGHIDGFTSPRYIHFVDDSKAYVTQLYDNRIAIIDPSRLTITGYISVPGMDMGMGSTERMAQIGRYLYVTCWSYQSRVLKIDTATDAVVASLDVGMQPCGITVDIDGKLWVACDGGYIGSPYGHEAPRLVRIDPATFTIEREFRFKTGDTVGDLTVSGDGTSVYWINGGVWRMNINATRLPSRAFIPSRDTIYYSLTVDPTSGDVYVADAIDYQQQGVVYRYSIDGDMINRFYVGVNPGAFCWKP